MRKFNQVLLCIFVGCITYSCSMGNQGNGGNTLATGEVYVWNQGAYGQGNASVTGYSQVTHTAVQNVFENKNNRPIGDTIESAALLSGNLYIVVNGSNRIEEVDPKTMQEIGAIDFQGAASPWQMVAAGQNTAYVTEFYNKSVAIIDLNQRKVTATISVGANPEGITTSNGKAYVAVSGLGRGDTVAVIDMSSNSLSRYIRVGDNPTVVKTDQQGRVWVVCTGNYGYDANGNYDPSLETFGKIYVIDSGNDSIVKTIDVKGHPGGITLLDKVSEAFVNNNGIQVIDMQQLKLNPDKFLKRSFYAIAVDPAGNTPLLYGAVVTDYTTAGRVVVYNAGATNPAVVDSFKTGINPGSFSFIPE